MSTREAWKRDNWKPQYLAEIWWCGDEVCNCYQPQITLRTPNLTAGSPWMRLTLLWEGEFQTDGETDGMQEALEAECARRDIPVGVSNATDVDVTAVRYIDAVEMDIAHRRDPYQRQAPISAGLGEKP